MLLCNDSKTTLCWLSKHIFISILCIFAISFDSMTGNLQRYFSPFVLLSNNFPSKRNPLRVPSPPKNQGFFYIFGHFKRPQLVQFWTYGPQQGLILTGITSSPCRYKKKSPLFVLRDSNLENGEKMGNFSKMAKNEKFSTSPNMVCMRSRLKNSDVFELA